MNCKYCGFDVPENDRFCSNCGAEVSPAVPVNENPVSAPEENFNGEYAQNNGGYGNPQGAYYSAQPGNGGYYAGSPQGYWAPPVNDKAPSLKDYLKWMLLYPLLNFIPGVGFIIYIVICIKHALDTTFTARANYFKAVLVAQIIGIVLAVLMFVFMFAFLGVVGGSFFAGLEELDPSFFMDEGFFMEEFNQVIRIFAK